jgi:hypothetical protein
MAENTAHAVFRVPNEGPARTPLTRNLCNLSTQYIYEFPMILTMNSDRSAVLFCEEMTEFVSRPVFVFKMSMRYTDTATPEERDDPVNQNL